MDYALETKDAVERTNALHAEQGVGDPFAAAVRATRMPMIITNPRQEDNPIVFANEAFFRLTGYSREECVGHNCRFLQGKDTETEHVRRLREAVAKRTDIALEILNYRKDGSTFVNALYMSPVFGHDGDLQFFFASQLDVTEYRMRESKALEEKAFFENAVRVRTAELQEALDQQKILLHEVDHRVKNNLQIISSMVRSQAHSSENDAVADALAETLSRIETLGAVHRRLYEASDISRFDAAGFIRELAMSLTDSANRASVTLDLDLEPFETEAQSGSPLGLLVNELLTNVLKHAFPHPEQSGQISIRTRQMEEKVELVIEDDGVGMSAEPPQADKRTFGHRLIRSLVRQLRATLEYENAHPGTRAIIRIKRGN